MKRTLLFLVLGALSCVLLACTQSQSGLHHSANSNLPKNVGIFGYSPVSYFEKGLAEQGDPQYNFLYKNRIFYFASPDQIETFKANPEMYLPRFGEYCPYSLSLGRKVGIDPTNFKVYDGQLLLFHNKVELSTVNDVVLDEVYELADKEYKILEF